MKGHLGVVGFDMDDTLISALAVTPYPGAKEKLHQLYNEGYNIVIVSNQKYSHTGDAKLLIKLQKVATALDVPFLAYCARGVDEYRKPNIGILKLIPHNLGSMKLFVGDAAGRSSDHSDVDKGFAANANLPFYVPEEYFFGGSSNAENILKRTDVPPEISDNILTMFILIGYPGSGKSTYARTILKNIYRVNRDTIGDMNKCIQTAYSVLSQKYSVVIDNTNNTIESRQKFINIAQQLNVRVIGIHIVKSMKESQEWDAKREKPIHKTVYYKYRKNFRSPSLSEGFFKIYNILD
jgi:bifunctional polynucleotide phosphatase/kinase